LAPDEETSLGETVARNPTEETVPSNREHHHHRHQDPVLQPPLVVLSVLAEDGLDRHVAGVDEADQTDEDFAAVASDETDQEKEDQSCRE